MDKFTVLEEHEGTLFYIMLNGKAIGRCWSREYAERICEALNAPVPAHPIECEGKPA